MNEKRAGAVDCGRREAGQSGWDFLRLPADGRVLWFPGSLGGGEGVWSKEPCLG